jgi:penicillin-binding protein 2
MSQFIANDQEAKEYLPRYRLLYALVGFTLTVFFLRLWYLQIINGAELRAFSEQNSIKETKIAAPRGIIYDRNGEILVENLPGFEITIAPQYLTDLNGTAETIGKILNIPPAVIVQTVERSRKLNGPFRPVRIKDNLSRNEIFSIELIKSDYSGIDIKENVLRSYPLKANGAQLFGYVGEISKRQLPILNEKYGNQIKFQQGDVIGKAGLEEVLDLYLRGKDGISVQQVDARGREAINETNLLGDLAGVSPATPGNNVILTLDKDIQEAAYNAFNGQDRIGGAVMMKTNGEILAWVSGPSYDPNEFSTGISSQIWSKLINDPDRPLRNKVIQDHNSPGSTFKPLMALAALTEKVITPHTIIACPGSFRFGNRAYHDSSKTGHGNLNVTQAIEASSNVFFYKMGIALGIDRMFKYCNALGIGRKTEVELQGERTGLMPSAEWKKQTIGEEWQPGENLSVAIGQGFVLTTPLQMAVAYNAIGNYGKIVKPFVVKKILSPENKVIKEFEPKVLRDLSDPTSDVHITKETFDVVREGMRLVVNGEHGTARVSGHLGFVELAGKTGTSQVMSFAADNIYALCEHRPKHQRHHGWFIGYAPADNPEVAFGILAEHACHGAQGAAPTAKEMVRAYVAKYHPEWLERDLKKKGAKPGAAVPAPAPAAVEPERIEGE